MQESSDKNKPQSESHNIPSKGLLGFSPTLTSIDQFSPNSAFAISSPGRPPSIPKSLAIPSSSPVVLGRSHEDASSITGLGDRKNSTDDLAAEVGFTPVNTASDARLLYRQWRTGSHIGADIDQVYYSESSGSFEEKNHEFLDHPFSNMSEVVTQTARSPFEQPSFFRSPPEQLPRISEKMENVPLFANSYDPDIQARLLSEQLEAAVEAEEEAKAVAQAGTSHPIGGSYGKKMPDANNSNITMKKAKSYQALEDLEKKGYFPSAPKPSAQGVQRGLKDSVVNDMCRAVVKHMVGDIYVPASSQYGAKKVLNHLYEPVLVSVQSHFKRLPARYALSVNPDDVPMHMRLLAKHQRNPQELNINVQLKKEDDGSITPNIYEVLVVSIDRNSLLDAITRALTSMKGSIMDADVMTTHDGVTLDRFVVKGSFMTEDRQKQLKARIEENLARLSLGEEDFPSEEVTKNKQDQTKVKEVEKEIEGAIKATQHKSENVGLAEKLGVLKMVGDNNIKAEWKLEMAEIRLSEPIGSGRSGQTYSAYWRGTKVAAKVVDSSKHSRSMGEDLLNEFHREVAVVSKLRHPNIVLFLGAAIAPPRYCLVFEFMENGTLTDLIRSRKAPIDFFRISKEIAMGMNYLHLCSIMHRDLKSGNVLLDTHGTVKISDFGLSCVLEIGSASSELTAETGTYRWMAPEVIRHEPYSNKADVYSFGVVLWEMIAKDQPFRGMTPIQAAFAVAKQMRPALPRHTPLKIGELVEHCWHQDPLRRPSFADILEALPLVKLSLKKRDFKNLGFVY